MVKLEDYKEGFNHLPKSDVLLFRLADESKIVVRPSGTEPKLKIYAGVRLKSFSSLEEGIAKSDKKLDDLLRSMHDHF